MGCGLESCGHHGEDAEGVEGPEVACRDLPWAQLNCSAAGACSYGADVSVACAPVAGVNCTGPPLFNITTACIYCAWLPMSEIVCAPSDCLPSSAAYATAVVECVPRDPELLCLGPLAFDLNLPCGGGETTAAVPGVSQTKRRRTAVALSVACGMWGCDRAYLGYPGLALGKAVTLGGFGVWAWIDALLIAAGDVLAGDGRLLLW